MSFEFVLQIRIGLENLLYKYGVDVHFQAHEHSYERMWPVYNLTVSLKFVCVVASSPSRSSGSTLGVDVFQRLT
jgi:hypothetical protein